MTKKNNRLARILLLETATDICSVGISQEGKLISLDDAPEPRSHASVITVLISEIMSRQGLTFHDLDAVAVSQGPGSYTGLRIGTSTAKGICFAAEIPLISIPTLKSLAAVYKNRFTETPPETILCPMLDARRWEVYCGYYRSSDLSDVNPVQVLIVEETAFRSLLERGPVHFFGTGSFKVKEWVEHWKMALQVDHVQASALGMAGMAEEAFLKGEFADTAYFEPLYLKDFVTTVRKKRF